MLTSKTINQNLSRVTHHATQRLQQAQSTIEDATQYIAQATDQLIDLNQRVSRQALDLTIKTTQNAVQQTLGQAAQRCEQVTEYLQKSESADSESSNDLKREGWSERTQKWLQSYADRILEEANSPQLKLWLERVSSLGLWGQDKEPAPDSEDISDGEEERAECAPEHVQAEPGTVTEEPKTESLEGVKQTLDLSAEHAAATDDESVLSADDEETLTSDEESAEAEHK